MHPRLLELAARTRGFMPADEGLALYRAGLEAGGPLLEIGGYCGLSALYLGAAAQQRGALLFSVDHHRGSEENQPGWEHHDPELVDPRTGRTDTLPFFRRTVEEAGLEQTVVAVIGDSAAVARAWPVSLALVFIDGGHGEEPAMSDYLGWAPRLIPAGTLAIHDVFPSPEDGGQAPYRVYRRALAEGFEQVAEVGSLRVLRLS